MANRYPKILYSGTRVKIKSMEELITAGNKSFNPGIGPAMLGLSGRIAYIDKYTYTKDNVYRYNLIINEFNSNINYQWTDHMFDVLPEPKLMGRFKEL